MSDDVMGQEEETMQQGTSAEENNENVEETLAIIETDETAPEETTAVAEVGELPVTEVSVEDVAQDDEITDAETPADEQMTVVVDDDEAPEETTAIAEISELPVAEASVEDVAQDDEITDAETPADEQMTVVVDDDEAPEVSGDDSEAEEEIIVVDENEEPSNEEPPMETPAPEETNYRFNRGDLVEGTIIKTSPTAIEVDFGDDLIGVVPGRELERMSRPKIEELQEGAQLMVYVVNPHDYQGNVVLSINRAIEEMDWKRAEEFRKDRSVYEGRVAGYNKGGLIVRFGRLRGFVPQSQLSEERRRNMQGDTPEERYGKMINDDTAVKVMEVDRSRNRLILSERAASRVQREKRKESVINSLTVGEIREGHVVSLEDFGAFVDIGGAEGLVHLTEISWGHVTHPRDGLEIGQVVKTEVISVDQKRKRIGLSIKRQEEDPWDTVATTYQVGDLVQAMVTKLTKFGAFARLVDSDDIEGLVHISELSEQRVGHPREVVNESEKLTLRVVKIDVKNRRLGLSLKRVNSAEYLDRDMKTFANKNSDEVS
jgi:small subunit ribosomal protein S1